jgi:two-component system response regulator RegA
MRLGDGNGSMSSRRSKRGWPDARAIILDRLWQHRHGGERREAWRGRLSAKPVDADDVVQALLRIRRKAREPPENPMSADRVRWEHIQRIYELCGRNVSETARRLNMHRRDLQRHPGQARAEITSRWNILQLQQKLNGA